jgi:hypothetical protein
MIYRLLLILVACAALLAGVQVPNFELQFENRVDAHLLEATANLRGFQQIADQEFGGSIEALIRKHEASTDPVFHDEAKAIRSIYDRVRRFAAQKLGLRSNLIRKLFFIAAHGDRELLRETYANYSSAVPMDVDAIASGVSLALVCSLVLELIRAGCLRVRRR